MKDDNDADAPESQPGKVQQWLDTLDKADAARFLLDANERRKEIYIEHAERELAQWRDLVKVFGLRSMTLLATLNGGAIALMLSLIAKGSESGAGFSMLVATFSPSLRWFSVGLVLAFCVAAFGYFNAAAGEGASLYASERYKWLQGDPMTEAFNRIDKSNPWVGRFAFASIGSAILSLVCFLVGLYRALSVDFPVT